MIEYALFLFYDKLEKYKEYFFISHSDLKELQDVYHPLMEAWNNCFKILQLNFTGDQS